MGRDDGIRPAKPIRQLLCAGTPEEKILSYMQNLYGASEQKLRLALEVAKTSCRSSHKTAKTTSGSISVSLFVRRGVYTVRLFRPTCGARKNMCRSICACSRRRLRTAHALQERPENGCRASISAAVRRPRLWRRSSTSCSEKCRAILTQNELYEYCVEAGRPDTITYEKLQVLKRHGVTRISINPQTMHASTLQLIGRSHTPEDIETAFSLARRVGFDTINADLIAGLPGETEADFQQTLCAIDRHEPENITVHTMSIKRGSALHESLSDYDLTNPNTVYNMLDLSQEFMAKTGRAPYYLYRQKNMLGNLENVGYSRAGHESIYNVNIMEEVQKYPRAWVRRLVKGSRQHRRAN